MKNGMNECILLWHSAFIRGIHTKYRLKSTETERYSNLLSIPYIIKLETWHVDNNAVEKLPNYSSVSISLLYAQSDFKKITF